MTFFLHSNVLIINWVIKYAVVVFVMIFYVAKSDFFLSLLSFRLSYKAPNYNSIILIFFSNNICNIFTNPVSIIRTIVTKPTT